MNQQVIGKFISLKRKEKNLTQEQLAEKIGVSNKTVSKWENGKCMPDYSVIEILCNELGITVSELLDGEENEKSIRIYDEKEILAALQQAQIPVKYSYSAGTYICNFLLYSSLAKRNKENADMKIGFIHVPYADGQHEDKPSLPMETIISALEIVLSKMF
jgi:transcriptional regulator with XRE-family HTH domain